TLLFGCGSEALRLVRERGELPVVLDGVPAGSKPVRLEDQKKHDRKPKHTYPQGCEKLKQNPQSAPQRSGKEAQQLWKQSDEYRSQDRPQDAAQPPDDDHAQIIDCHREWKILRANDPSLIGEQRASDTHVERAHAKGQKLVFVNIDSHDFRGDV